jgi:hypothetical protein
MSQVTSRGQRRITRAGFVLGVALAAGVLVAGHVPAGERSLDAHMSVAAAASGGVTASPEHRVLASGRLAPGGAPVEGSLRLLNQTSSGVTVLVRAASEDRSLDDLARVELRASGRRPLRTTLGALRSWQPLGGELASHRRRRVVARACIPRSVSGGYEARRVALTLEFTRKGVER